MLTIRHDDFDFRLAPEEYIANHEKFIKAGLIETPTIQFTHDGRLNRIDSRLSEYMKTAPNWDIQLHCWAHDDYSKLPKWRIYDDLQRAKVTANEVFGVEPTTWFPPWNCYSDDMKEVADLLSLKIDNESYDIAKFIREVKAGIYSGHSVYFHLWNAHEASLIDEMIEVAKTLK